MWKCRKMKIFRNINSMMHKDFLELHQLTQIVEQQRWKKKKKFFISITWLSNSLLHFYVNIWKIHQHFRSIVCLSCGGRKTNFSADSKCILTSVGVLWWRLLNLSDYWDCFDADWFLILLFPKLLLNLLLEQKKCFRWPSSVKLLAYFKNMRCFGESTLS